MAGKTSLPMLSDSSGAIGELCSVYDREEGVDVRGRLIIDQTAISRPWKC